MNSSVIGEGIVVVVERLEPVLAAADAFVQCVANLAAGKLCSCHLHGCIAAGSSAAGCAVHVGANIIVVGKDGVAAVEPANEHAVVASACDDGADGEAVLDCELACVVVANDAATLTICSLILYFAVEEAVGDVDDGCYVVVDVADDAADVTCVPAYVDCARIDAVLNDSCAVNGGA